MESYKGQAKLSRWTVVVMRQITHRGLMALIIQLVGGLVLVPRVPQTKTKVYI